MEREDSFGLLCSRCRACSQEKWPWLTIRLCGVLFLINHQQLIIMSRTHCASSLFPFMFNFMSAGATELSLQSHSLLESLKALAHYSKHGIENVLLIMTLFRPCPCTCLEQGQGRGHSVENPRHFMGPCLPDTSRSVTIPFPKVTLISAESFPRPKGTTS